MRGHEAISAWLWDNPLTPYGPLRRLPSNSARLATIAPVAALGTQWTLAAPSPRWAPLAASPIVFLSGVLPAPWDPGLTLSSPSGPRDFYGTRWCVFWGRRYLRRVDGHKTSQ